MFLMSDVGLMSEGKNVKSDCGYRENFGDICSISLSISEVIYINIICSKCHNCPKTLHIWYIKGRPSSHHLKIKKIRTKSSKVTKLKENYQKKGWSGPATLVEAWWELVQTGGARRRLPNLVGAQSSLIEGWEGQLSLIRGQSSLVEGCEGQSSLVGGCEGQSSLVRGQSSLVRVYKGQLSLVGGCRRA